jgi:hypothetical protein
MCVCVCVCARVCVCAACARVCLATIHVFENYALLVQSMKDDYHLLLKTAVHTSRVSLACTLGV